MNMQRRSDKAPVLYVYATVKPFAFSFAVGAGCGSYENHFSFIRPHRSDS